MESEGRVRVSPLQPRGKQSVGKMLDATGELIDEVGYEHLTTQQVARRSGVSIGLVYHYFPDRLALVEALIARNSERFMAAVTERLDKEDVTTWRDALNAVLDVLVDMYRHEPGFFKIGLNDRFLTAQSAPIVSDQDNLAAAFLGIFRDRFAPRGPETPDLLLHFEIAVQMGDALMGRAFRSEQNGDERVLAEARTVLANYLAPFLDRPADPADEGHGMFNAQSERPTAEQDEGPSDPPAPDNTFSGNPSGDTSHDTSNGDADRNNTGRGDFTNGNTTSDEDTILSTTSDGDPLGGYALGGRLGEGSPSEPPAR